MGRVKALLQPANFSLGPDATLNTEINKISVRINAPNSVNASKRKIKLITMINKNEYSWLLLLCARALRKHAYSNILKILPPKKEDFQIKSSDIFIFLLKT